MFDYDSLEEEYTWREATEEESADYHAGYITANENVRETDHGIEFRV